MFPFQYFHIGGDENAGKHWDESEHIQQFMKENDLKTNHEVIEHGINGFIVPIDKQKLEETINHVLSLSDEEIKKIRVLNKELINKRFNMEKNFKKMDRLLK